MEKDGHGANRLRAKLEAGRGKVKFSKIPKAAPSDISGPALRARTRANAAKRIFKADNKSEQAGNQR